MAKSKKKDKKSDGAQADAVDSIRAAIERGLQVSAEGAQATRERTRELVDEIAAAAGRVRHSLEDLRVLDELRRLRTEVEALATRVAALEHPGSSSSSTSPTPSTPTAPAAPARPAAAKSRAKTSSSRARKPAAKKTSSTTAAKKSASPRSRAKPAGTSGTS